jgi:hypothetical protein
MKNRFNGFPAVPPMSFPFRTPELGRSRYIARQEEHHQKKTFADELKLFVERYGLQWRADKTVETV